MLYLKCKIKYFTYYYKKYPKTNTVDILKLIKRFDGTEVSSSAG